MEFEKGASSLKVDGTDERKFSVLVVDDDATVRKIHSKFVGKFPVDVQEAVNGKEAVDLYRSGAFFDLVLMDLEMPIMNGFEVCFSN
jgi:CheY-like chemotaxis protein